MNKFIFPNSEPCIITDPAITHGFYPTAEHCFQAMKTRDKEWMNRIAEADTPEEAIKIGRMAPLIENWDGVKIFAMKHVLSVKFRRGTEHHDRLIATGGDDIYAFNFHHDNFWGFCRCGDCIWNNVKKYNVLGKLIMKIRKMWHFQYLIEERKAYDGIQR
jgi:ribA/ribD-fused uncharacterized protein